MEVIDMQLRKYKLRLVSEHTFKHTAEFLQSSFYRPRVAVRALILHASNETQRINVWLLFLITITDILDKENVFVHFISSKTMHRYPVIVRGLAKQLTDFEPY